MTARLLRRLLGADPRRYVWPVTLAQAGIDERGLASEARVVRLRPLRRGDEAAWYHLRVAEDARLAPWEATLPFGSGEVLPTFRAHVRRQNALARRGEVMSFAVEVDGAFAGQVVVSPITWGPLRSANVGYWIGAEWEGRGLMGLSVAMVLDHLLGPGVGLHRVEINVRPDNARSLAMCGRLGLRDEGLRHSLMHVDGAWADHRSFAVVAEDPVAGEGFVARLERGSARSPRRAGS